MAKKLFLLDAAGFVFRSYCALPILNAPSGASVQAVFGLIRSFNKLVKDFNPDYLVAVFDGPDNKKSRRALYSEYKANRVMKYPDLPQQMDLVKEYCRLAGITYFDQEGVEADDVIASLTRLALQWDFEIFICTSDKDLFQLVGEKVFIVNPWKNNLILGKDEVKDQFGIEPVMIPDYLSLVGDSSDNIPGLPGCGPKGAVGLLAQFSNVIQMIAEADKITSEKRRQLVLDNREQILLSRELALLDSQVPLVVSEQELVLRTRDSDQQLLNAFYGKLGFKSFILNSSEESSPVKMPCNCRIVESVEVAEVILNRWALQSDVAIVMAYTGKILTELVVYGMALSDGVNESWFFPARILEPCSSLLKIFFKNKSLIAYDNKYDKHALASLGINRVNIHFDVVLAAYLLHAEQGHPSFSSLISRYLSEDYSKFFIKMDGRVGLPVPEQVLEPEKYFGLFAYCVSKLKHALSEQLIFANLESLFQDLEMPLSSLLFDMERVGMPFHKDRCCRLSEKIELELKRVVSEIYRCAGEEFNIKSTKQLGKILFDKLGLRRWKKESTNAEVLDHLVDDHPIISYILEFRSLEKLRSSYLTSLMNHVDPNDGRIHCTFSQSVTATGRLACRDPNLQNIPVRTPLGKKIRELFQPFDSEYVFLAADYSQIELRFLAHFSGDANLKNAFLSGEDIHTHTAAEVFGVSMTQVTDEQRYQAKAVNFGIIYGQQAFGLSKVLKINLSKAQHLIDTYFLRYPGLQAFMESTLEKAAVEGQVKTILGRGRVIDSWSKSFDKAHSGRLAINTLLQGSAADLIKRAMLLIQEALNEMRLKSKLILQIHDELLFESSRKECEILAQIAKEKMETAMDLEVPLVVNILIGKNWSEC